MAFSFGSGVNAGLGRADFSEIAQAGRATAQGIASAGAIKGQSIANLGQGIANSIQQYQTKKLQSDQYKSIAKSIASNEGLAKQFGIKKDADGTYDEALIYKSVQTLGTPEAVGNFVLNAGREEEAKRVKEAERTRSETEQRRSAEQLGVFAAGLGSGNPVDPEIFKEMTPQAQQLASQLLASFKPEPIKPGVPTTQMSNEQVMKLKDNGIKVKGLQNPDGTWTVEDTETMGAPPVNNFNLGNSQDELLMKTRSDYSNDLVSRAKTGMKTVAGLDRLMETVNNGDVKTGIFAKIIQYKNRVLAGKSPQAAEEAWRYQVANATLGSDVFNLFQSLGVGARGLDTVAEREFMMQVLTGDLTMQKRAILEMALKRRLEATSDIDEYNNVLNQEDGGLRDYLSKARYGNAQEMKYETAPSFGEPTAPNSQEIRTDKATGQQYIRNQDGQVVPYNP